MARGYTLLSGRNRLIPRVEIEGRKRSWEKGDPESPFINDSRIIKYTPFLAVECVIQPMRGKAQRDQNAQLEVSGAVEYDSYTVYSETLLYRANEGTDQLSDQLLLPDSGGGKTWFTVMKADQFVSSGTARYRYYLIAVPEGTEGGL